MPYDYIATGKVRNVLIDLEAEVDGLNNPLGTIDFEKFTTQAANLPDGYSIYVGVAGEFLVAEGGAGLIFENDGSIHLAVNQSATLQLALNQFSKLKTSHLREVGVLKGGASSFSGWGLTSEYSGGFSARGVTTPLLGDFSDLQNINTQRIGFEAVVNDLRFGTNQQAADFLYESPDGTLFYYGSGTDVSIGIEVGKTIVTPMYSSHEVEDNFGSIEITGQDIIDAVYDVGSSLKDWATESINSIYEEFFGQPDPGETVILIEEPGVGSRLEVAFVNSGTPGANAPSPDESLRFGKFVGASSVSTNSYVVQPGDSLSQIASQNGVSLQDLVAANPHITDPNTIFSGDVVKIPGVSQTSFIIDKGRENLISDSSENSVSGQTYFGLDGEEFTVFGGDVVSAGGWTGSVGELDQQIAKAEQNYFGLVEKNHAAAKWIPDGSIEYQDQATGQRYRLKAVDNNGDGTVDQIVRQRYLGDSEAGGFVESVIGDTNNDGSINTQDVSGDIKVIQPAQPIITGQQIGQFFGSSLGNYLADGNPLAQIAYGATLSTVFSSIGLTADRLFNDDVDNDPSNGAQTENLEEALDTAFANFGNRLAANAISIGISQASSFLAGEVVGGEGIAADLGRTAVNAVISSALSEVAVEVANGLEMTGLANLLNGHKGALGEFDPSFFSADQFGVSLGSAIGSYFGSQLANSLVQVTTPEGALVSSVVSSITGYAISSSLSAAITAGSTAGSSVGGFFTGAALSIGTAFIGTFIGVALGNALGSLLIDEDYPRAYKPLGFNSTTGRVEVGSGGAELDGLTMADVVPIAQAVADGYNSILDLMGTSAIVSSNTGGGIAAIGYIAVDDYNGRQRGYVVGRNDLGSSALDTIWNQAGFDATDVSSALQFALQSSYNAGEFSGGDALGRRIVNYGGAQSLDDFVAQLKIAEEYRKYLANKEVIDRLIDEAPDTAFSIGWIATLAQAEALGLRSAYSLHEKTIGTSADETLNGTKYVDANGVTIHLNDELSGVGGTNTLNGLAGNDLLRSGSGADTMNGGEGNDTVSYRDAGGAVTINLATQTVSGVSAENDTITSIERAIGSAHDDTLIGSDNDDVLAGLGGADTISGGAGDDIIEGGAGADILDGGEGEDIASYGTASEGVYATLDGTQGLGGDALGDVLTNFEILSGSNYSDFLVGSDGDDTLQGLGGHDFLEGGAGADRINGDTGHDFAVYTNSDAGVVINLETGEASGGHAEGDELASIEYLIGSGHADTLTGNAYTNVIEGGAGADILDGGDGEDVLSYAGSSEGVHLDFVGAGGNGVELLGGDAAGDQVSNFEHIIASNHDDEIYIYSDNTTVLAGAGNDKIYIHYHDEHGTERAARVDGGDGIDELYLVGFDTGANVYSFYNRGGFFAGFSWGETLVNFGTDIYNVWENVRSGGDFSAPLFAQDTELFDIGIHSIEYLVTTDHDDIIDFSDNTNLADNGGFAQRVKAGAGDDVSRGREGHDEHWGQAGNDVLVGGLGNDHLYGGAGDDKLYGETDGTIFYGDQWHFVPEIIQSIGPYNAAELAAIYAPYGAHDRLDGGAGNDLLSGDFGNDTYVFGEGYGSDTVIDEAYVKGPWLIPVGGQFHLPSAAVQIDGGTDTLELADGLTPDDVDFIMDGHDVVVRIRGTQDEIRLTDWADTQRRVENVYFSGTDQTMAIASVPAISSALSDAATPRAATWEYLGITTANFSTQWGNMAATPRTVFDFNSDGRADLIRVHGGSVYVTFGQLDGSFSGDVVFGGASFNGLNNGFALGDVNNDGWADFVGFDANGNPATVAITPNIDAPVPGQGMNYFGITSLPAHQVPADHAAHYWGPTLWPNPAAFFEAGTSPISGDHPQYKADANNDGIADLITFGNDGVYGALGNGDGTYQADALLYGGAFGYSQGWGAQEHNPRFVGDINGDGYADFIGITSNGTHVALSKSQRTVGTLYADNVQGTAGSDVLRGFDGNDSIFGLAGDDVLDGGLGSDYLDGGAGDDTADFGGSLVPVSINLNHGNASDATGDVDTLISIEHAKGSIHNDVIYAGTGANHIDGASGQDQADYRFSDGHVEINLATGVFESGFAAGDTLVNIENVYGSAFDDVIVGDNGNNSIWGHQGTNELSGLGGNDSIVGGDGRDTIRGGDGNDSLSGGDGDDTIYGGSGSDTIVGGDGSDIVVFEYAKADYTLTMLPGDSWQVVEISSGDVDSVSSVENLQFSDELVALHNTAPSIASVLAGQTVDEDAPYTFTVPSDAFLNADELIGDALTLSASMADGSPWPTWLSFHAESGTFSGTPENGDVGVINVKVEATDSRGLSAAQTFSLTVENTNDAPVVVQAPTNQVAIESQAFSYTLADNTFTDIDVGDSLSLSAALSGGGVLPSWLIFDEPTKTFSIVPGTSQAGTLTIEVTAADASNAVAQTTFELIVEPPNEAPEVVLATVNVDEGQSVQINLASYVTDPEGGLLTYSLVGELASGEATLVDGNLTYVSEVGGAGTYDILYDVTDDRGATVRGTATVSVQDVNFAPTLSSSASAIVDEGQVITVDLTAFVTDLDGDALTYQLDGDATVGTATIDGALLTYTSVVGGVGLVPVAFTVSDGIAAPVAGSIDLQVNDINFAPDVTAASSSIDEGETVTIDLAGYTTDLDNDTLSYALGIEPALGTATLDGSLLTYASVVGGYGLIPVSFVVSDGNGGSTSGTVDVEVNNINFAPTAAAASHDVDWGGTINVDLASLVSDVDGDVLSFGVSQGPLSGVAAVNGSILTYTSAASVGVNSVTYSVSDGAGGTAQNTLSFTTLPQPNNVPIAVGDSYVGTSIAPRYIAMGDVDNLLANDTDPDGDTIRLYSVGNPTGAVLSVSIVYFADGVTPAGVQPVMKVLPVGVHSGTFSYTITDDGGGFATATASYQYEVIDLGPITKPIILDLDGDGIELVNASDADIFFDINADGEAERTGWAAADDGLLVFDKDMDGAATDIDEISFVGYKEGARTDLEGLRAFDTNGDGLLDSGDAQFGQFKVWRDANQDGISQKGELVGLTAAGISAIELTSDETVRVVGDNVSFGIGAYHRTDGTSGLFSDTGFGSEGVSINADALDAIEIAAADAGFGGGNKATVHQLRAGLDEVLETGGAAGLLDTQASSTGQMVVLDNAMTGLVSAMAAFDAQAAGQSSLNNRPEDNAASHQLAAWVS